VRLCSGKSLIKKIPAKITDWSLLSNRVTLAPESWRDFPIRIAGLEGKTLSQLEPELFAEILQGDLLPRLRADWEDISDYWRALHDAILARSEQEKDFGSAERVAPLAHSGPDNSEAPPRSGPTASDSTSLSHSRSR
jgi:hypothetical protein